MKNVLVGLLSFLLGFLGTDASAEIPEYVRALDGTPVPVSNPGHAPADWTLAHIDVETTGLVPGYHEMIDIGVVMTDLEGHELAEKLGIGEETIDPLEHTGMTGAVSNAEVYRALLKKYHELNSN